MRTSLNVDVVEGYEVRMSRNSNRIRIIIFSLLSEFDAFIICFKKTLILQTFYRYDLHMVSIYILFNSFLRFRQH